MTRVRHAKAFLTTLLMIGIALAGCLGGGTDTLDEGDDDAEPFDETTGAIEGAVLTPELFPVQDAVVGIPALEVQTFTDEAGKFLLGHVPAGEHRVVVQAIGHESVANRVDVVAGEILSIQFSIAVLPVAEAYHELFPFSGYQSCQWYVPIGLSTCTLPYAQAYGFLHQNGYNLSQYGLPEDPLPSRDKYNFTMSGNHTGVISELIWEPASAAASHQALIIACGWWDPVLDECVPPGETTTGVRYFGKVGTSPIQIHWTHPEPDHLPWVMSRANVNGNTSEGKPAGIALDQRIDMYNTVFYGAEPPTQYTAGPRDQ